MEEENDWAVSNLGETDICVLGKYNTDKHVRFYRIKVPDPKACPPPSYFSSPLFKLKKKKKQFSPKELSPLSLKLKKKKKGKPRQSIYFAVLGNLKKKKKGKPWPSKYFAMLGNHLYAVGGEIKTRKKDVLDIPEDYSEDEDVSYSMDIETKDVWILDLTSPHKGWKAGPPMNFRRCDPQMVVVDGKLFVFGGLRFKPKGNSGWMEVFDPLSQTWESLPNPPSYFDSDEEDILHAVLEAKHEIVVARPRDSGSGNANFYSYNVVGGFWKNLEPKPSKRALCCYGRAVVVGNTLYWATFLSRESEHCTLYYHDLEKNVWLQECLCTSKILGEYEFLDASFRPGFLHLCDKKFCLILRSGNPTPEDPFVSVEFLYCIILDLSPNEGSSQWNVSVLSVQKYLLNKYLNLLDCLIL